MAIDIRTLLCYKLFALVKANEDFIDKEMSQFDLSRTQWKILIRFNFLEVPCPQQQLLKAIDIDAAHLTRVLDQLEKRKLLVRTRLPSDKRVFTIELTLQGKALLKKMEKMMNEESALMIESLEAKEIQHLNNILEKITSTVFSNLNKKLNHKRQRSLK